jgi:calmodulin
MVRQKYLRLVLPYVYCDCSQERSGHLTKKQIAEYKEAFNLIDKDGSGRISRNELSSLFLALRQKVTSAELKDLMTGVDTDGR